jgi:cytochrome c oxidase assembly protein subunit 11
MLTTANRKIAVTCAAVAFGMLGLAYASVPLYRLFCQVTGFGGTTMRAERPSSHVSDRTVTVRFDANVGPGLSWEFKPLQPTMVVRLGENAMVSYRATNTSDKPMVGSATFNVTPDQSGAFFNKLACFCFTEQRLEPGESMDMPVSYFVDPEIVKDIDASRLTTVTLSYTFYEVKKPAAARADTGKAKDPTGKPEAGTRG